jgi:hypothetical protein
MSETEETKPIYGCEFCNRKFARERTLVSHICETKSRWLSRDTAGNRLGYQCFLQFYKKNTTAKKPKPYEEYIRSPYYTAFAKFGSYCVDVQVINVSRYVDWLLKDSIKLDNWATDANYTKFLCEYLRIEDPFDAIYRSVEKCVELGEAQNILPNDVLRFGNVNKICYAITTGKISPWMLYCSDSGTQFLANLNEDHVRIVIDYINPQQWALKFNRDENLKQQIRDTLQAAGY